MLRRVLDVLLNKWCPISLLVFAASLNAALLVNDVHHHQYEEAWTMACGGITCCITIWGIFTAYQLFQRARENHTSAFVYWTMSKKLAERKVNDGN